MRQMLAACLCVAFATAPAARTPVLVLGITDEIQPITAHLQRLVRTSFQGFHVSEGKLGETRVIVAGYGTGKVAAATAAAVLISHYRPSLVVISGTSGRLSNRLNIGDVVYSRGTVQHDLGQQTDSAFTRWPTSDPRTGQDNPLVLQPALSTYELASQVAYHFSPQPFTLAGITYSPSAHSGLVATGDTFVASPLKASELRSDLGADVVEMESCAVAQVCTSAHVKWLAVRSVSDGANDHSPGDYSTFLKDASKASAAFTESLLAEKARQEHQKRIEVRPNRKVCDLYFELPFADGSPYSARFPNVLDLPFAKQLNLSREVLGLIVRKAARNLRIHHLALDLGPGAYTGAVVHCSAHLRFLGLASQERDMASFIGLLAQQNEIIGTASGGRDCMTATMSFPDGQDFPDPTLLQHFWDNLVKANSPLTEGFSTIGNATNRKLIFLDTGSRWAWDQRASITNQASTAASVLGRKIKIVWGYGSLLDYCNPWVDFSSGRIYQDTLIGPPNQVRQNLLNDLSRQVSATLQAAFGHGLSRSKRVHRFRKHRPWKTSIRNP